jgi:hypothetical protein
MTYADANTVLQTYLCTAGTALYGLVGSEVHWPRLPAAHKPTTSAVSFESIGGGGMDVLLDDTACWYRFKCYGGTATHAAARAVYTALCYLLHSAMVRETASGVIVCGQQISNGQDLFDDRANVGWPYVMTQFSIMVRPTN